MIDPATLRIGLLVGQLGLSAVRELIGLFNKTGATLPEVETILVAIEKDRAAADAATDVLLKH